MGFMHPDTGDEDDCVDIDECQLFDNVCVHGQCENQHGMFKCFCDEGFKLDESGGNCTDINECEDINSCMYGDCSNTLGGYKCKCPDNFDNLPGEYLEPSSVSLTNIVLTLHRRQWLCGQEEGCLLHGLLNYSRRLQYLWHETGRGGGPVSLLLRVR